MLITEQPAIEERTDQAPKIRVRTSITWTSTPTMPPVIPLLMSPLFIAAGWFLIRMSVRETSWPGLQGKELVLASVGGVFGLVGCAMLVSSASGLVRQLRVARLRREHPAEPWHWDDTWDPEGAWDSTAANAGRGLSTALMIGLFMVPFHVIAGMGKPGIFWLLGIGVFDAIAGLMLVYAVYMMLRRMKWGASRLRFHRFPYAPGGRLEVQLVVPDRGRPFDALTITLRCVQEQYVRRAGNTSLDRRALHEAARTLRPETDGTLSRPSYDISFELPADVPGTMLRDYPRIYWELEARGAAPGVDYGALFKVPVYARG
jgi:hypothetical protein